MEPHPKVQPPKLVRCPHCGNRTRHECVHREDYAEILEIIDDRDAIWDEKWWAILKCSTCTALSLYVDHWDDEARKWTTRLAYPVPRQAPAEVPPEISHFFDEAMLVSKQSPALAAVALRKCLEGIASDRNASGPTLLAQIRDLANRDQIPQQLADMMNVGRSIGNIGAHYGNVQVTDDDIEALTQFTLALFEYIYVAPARIEALRASLAERKNPAEATAG
jgi:hypothetical protein